MIGNSGRFRRTLELLLGDAPFARFLRFSDWLYATARKTHEIALERLYGFVHAFLTKELGMGEETVAAAMEEDYAASGARGRLRQFEKIQMSISCICADLTTSWFKHSQTKPVP